MKAKTYLIKAHLVGLFGREAKVFGGLHRWISHCVGTEDSKAEAPTTLSHYTSTLSSAEKLTIDLQHGVNEAVGFILKSVVGAKRNREIAVRLLITNKHLHL